MQLDFHTLDVFTDCRYGGNPLVVVLGADGLSEAQMQAIAREFNLSETVFVLKAASPAHTARLRIFTPSRELPFAGHPSIGAAVLLAEQRSAGQTGERDALVVLEEEIGTVRVGVRMRAGQAAFAELDAPKLPQAAGILSPVEKLAAGLGLIPSEIGFENHRPACFAAGAAFAFVPIANLEALNRARVNGPHWAEAFEEQGLVGAYLYTRQCIHTGHSFHARVFAPGSGIPEDPATGSAAVSLAGVIHKYDAPPDGVHRRVIEQGYALGRPSQVVVTLSVDGGKLTGVRIGGHAVPVAEGRISV
jgi:trans-2,3-dihydro-3-hydroxyanthranilate isomerase